MAGRFDNNYDPFEEMHAFYRLDDPTEEQQFRFVESMQYLIETAYEPIDIIAFSFNLAMYYRDIRNFSLEKKYLMKGAGLGDSLCKEQLGIIWYYGLGGEQDYGKAFQCFTDSKTRTSKYMLADMYRYGHGVEQNRHICRAMIDDLFAAVQSERKDSRFTISTLFPEIALRFVQTDLEDGTDTEFDLECLFDARDILVIRQKNSPFWGNIKTMRQILETTGRMCGLGYNLIDLYDLLTLHVEKAGITFKYDGKVYRLDIFPAENESVYQFEDKWYHGAEDFLEKARIKQHRITTIMDAISEIKILLED